MNNKRVCDLPIEEVKVGLRIVSLSQPDRIGTITHVDEGDDGCRWVTWDGQQNATSCFYGNDCECEVAYDPKFEAHAGWPVPTGERPC